MKAALALCVMAGCAADSATRVHLAVHGDLQGIDQYELAIGSHTKMTTAYPELDLLLPDDMAGKMQEIDIVGLAAGTQIASGSARVTPELHAKTMVDVTLTPIGDDGSCGGTATACAMLGEQTSCGAQQGCAWTAQACQGMASGCDTIDPNECAIRPQCLWDILFEVCFPDPTWCAQSTPAACAANSGCTWSGGCSGTAAACNSLTVQTCAQQRGCVVMGK